MIDALGKVAEGPQATVNLPRAELETMRRTLDEAYRLIDTTPPHHGDHRPGDIALLAAEDGREAARLDHQNEWMPAEKKFPRYASFARPCGRRRRWPESRPVP